MELNLDMTMPKKRTEILYSRVTPQSKKFIEKLALEKDVSEAALVDFIIDEFRKAHARFKKRPRQRP